MIGIKKRGISVEEVEKIGENVKEKIVVNSKIISKIQ